MKRTIWLLAAVLMLCIAPALAEAGMEPEVDTLLVAVGKYRQIELTFPTQSHEKAGVTYLSSDESIATVTRTGQVIGQQIGECDILITSKKDASLTCVQHVQIVKPVQSISAALEENVLYIGQNARISFACLPQDASVQDAVFVTGQDEVAVVSDDGLVTGVGRGQTSITVRSADGYAKTTVRVTVRQQPESMRLSRQAADLIVGDSLYLNATVFPGAAVQDVVWSSSDESVARVNGSGYTTAVGPGDAVITAASATHPDVKAGCAIHSVQLAESIRFDQEQYDVLIGETLQLAPIVLPENTSDKTVAYRVDNPRILSVDENGLVTTLKGGKTKVTAIAQDGSGKRRTITVRVVVPVTGVSFEKKAFRVGAGGYTYLTAILEPEDATIRDMIWESSDETLVTIKGGTDTVRVNGHRWGRGQITGTTVDGGYSASIMVNVGSLRRAVVVEEIAVREGRPYITLRNRSNMNITRVTFRITGTDEFGNPITLSRKYDHVLHGSYKPDLAPGESTSHGSFSFHDYISGHTPLQSVQIAITGWETDTGYYDSNDELAYSYHISSGYQEWHYDDTKLYRQTQEALRQEAEKETSGE